MSVRFRDGPSAADEARLQLPPALRLSMETLGMVPLGVRRPAYDCRALRPGILHIGCGAFHQAHQGVLTQRAIEAECSSSQVGHATAVPPWGIVSASLRSPRVTRNLNAQDGLYTVLESGPGGQDAEIVGALREAIFVPSRSAAFDAWMASPEIRIVTLTITLAGYCLEPKSGRLDADHPDIRADLDGARTSSAIGLLVRGLALRRSSGTAPPVIISCDNNTKNGDSLRQGCIDFAALRDDSLADWIARHVQFPNTMVDRIVPSPTLVDRIAAADAIGMKDAAAVSSEPFCQWVIQQFDGPRPRWDAVGAEFVADVAPWETSKLRLLNGSHLVIAYLGLLAGFDTVASAMSHSGLRALILRFMLDEQRPTLPESDHDIALYANQLIVRWCNPGISHSLERVACNGASKLPERLLAPLLDNLRAQRAVPGTVLGLAAWMCCATGSDARLRRLALGEDEVRQLPPGAFDESVEPRAVVDACLGMKDVFGPGLCDHPGLRTALLRGVAALQRRGARSAIDECLRGDLP